jgi:hypothetical protein
MFLLFFIPAGIHHLLADPEIGIHDVAHGVAVEAAARDLRHQCVEGDVRRHQPEIDDCV